MREITEDDINKIETILGELNYVSIYLVHRKQHIKAIIEEAEEWVSELKKEIIK